MPTSSSPPSSVPVFADPLDLVRRGIVSVPLAPGVWDDRVAWARRNMAPHRSPLLMFAADQAEPVYRNVLSENDDDDDDSIPLERIRASLDPVIATHFGIVADALRIDDAFAIHYHVDQERTSGAKHVDPSDVTINLCLDAADDCVGSRVLFHGRMPLSDDADTSQPNDPPVHNSRKDDPAETFLVEQRPGVATLHWGSHPHETTSLERGHRTNLILTLCYKDTSKSDVASRSCYHV